VSAIALAERLPSWAQYAERLRQIKDISDQLIACAHLFGSLTMRQENDLPFNRGVLSLDTSVKHYLRSCGARPSVEIDTSTIRSICIDALEHIGPLASKRGPRADLNFRFFMGALLVFAELHDARVTLPSRQSKGQYGSPYRTPFFQFCRAVLDLASSKGRVAIEQADLPPIEKEHALKRLSHSNKTDGGILEDLHKVRQASRGRQRKARAGHDSSVFF
jgi:hypothetical protein